MKFITKIVDYKGQAIVKLPRKVSEKIGLKTGDKYTTELMPDGSVFVKFIKSHSHNA